MFALVGLEKYYLIFASFGTYFSALALAVGNYALKGNNRLTSIFSYVCYTPLLNLVSTHYITLSWLLIKTCP